MAGIEEQLGLNKPKMFDEYLDSIANVYSRVKGVLELYNDIRSRVSTEPLNKLVHDNRYLELLLGGLSDNGDSPFTEDAMARFTASILGVTVSEENAKKIIARMQSGDTLEEACRGIELEVRDEPEHLVLLRLLSERLQEALEKTGRELPEPYQYKFDQSDDVVQALADTLTWARKLLPLYNPASFFIQSLYSIPRYYAQQAYPNLKHVEKLLEEKLATRLETIHEPDIANNEIREKTTIIGITEDSAALSILKAIHIVYRLFQLNALKKYYDIEDEFDKYIKMYKSKLSEAVKEASATSQVAEILPRMDCSEWYSLVEQPNVKIYASSVFVETYERYGKHKRCRSTINAYIHLFYEYVITYETRGKYRTETLEGPYSIKLMWPEFVNIFAPAMFLGIAYVRGRRIAIVVSAWR